MTTQYATFADLVQYFGLTEIAGISTPDELMTPSAAAVRTIMDAGDEEIAWPEWITIGEQAAAQACIDRSNFALNVASKEIDSSVGVVYSLPLSPDALNQSMVVSVCCDLARYFLYDDKVTQEVVDRAKGAREWLKSIVNGTTVLLGANASTVTSSASTDIVVPASDWDISRW
jgi:phage gp36-like protein